MASKEQQELNKQFEEQIQALQTQLRENQGIQGPAGPAGPAGPPGVPGATFNFQGKLYNASRLDMATDRTINQDGTTNSRVFLNTPQSSTNQMWSLHQGGLFRNQWGQCMEARKNANASPADYSVYMAACNEESQNQKWLYDNIGRIQWQGGEDTCLTIAEVNGMPEGTTNEMSMGFPIEGTKKKNYMMLTIDSCGGADLNPSQPRPKTFREAMQWIFS
jgi:hypothetical protein